MLEQETGYFFDLKYFGKLVLRELYSKLAEIIRECPGQYYRYHGDWRSETQTVVPLFAFMHWLEIESLLLHAEAEEKLGLNPSDLGLDIEDYLIVGLQITSSLEDETCSGTSFDNTELIKTEIVGT